MGQTDAKRDFVNACASVDSDMKRKVLDSKVKLIDSAIEATLERLAKLPEDEYFAMLKRLAEQKLRKGSGLISLSANDLKRLPADFETDIRSSAEKLGGTLEISKKPADISDGFILSYGLISENCSFRAIIEKISALPVREKIGRFKYVAEENTDAEYDKLTTEISSELHDLLSKEED